jgi:hypothetical protein
MEMRFMVAGVSLQIRRAEHSFFVGTNSGRFFPKRDSTGSCRTDTPASEAAFVGMRVRPTGVRREPIEGLAAQDFQKLGLIFECEGL